MPRQMDVSGSAKAYFDAMDTDKNGEASFRDRQLVAEAVLDVRQLFKYL